MLERPETRFLLRGGLSAWALAVLAAAWELMAQQAPNSPFHLGVLAGPVAQLRDHALALGVCLVLAALLWPFLYERGRGRFALAALLGGSIVTIAALGYGALRGVMAVQLLDPRPDVRSLVIVRAVGHALLLLAVLAAARQSFRR